MAEKLLDLRVASALLASATPLTLDGIRDVVGRKYTDGELRASLIRLGGFHVDDAEDGEPRFALSGYLVA
jgi:hypothetical protein